MMAETFLPEKMLDGQPVRPRPKQGALPGGEIKKTGTVPGIGLCVSHPTNPSINTCQNPRKATGRWRIICSQSHRGFL